MVATSLYAAEAIYTSLLDYLHEDDIAFFPADELFRAEAISSGKEFLAQRLYTLYRLGLKKPKILLTHPAALMRFQPDPVFYKKSLIRFRVGDRYDLGELKSRLIDLGYKKVDKIDQSLQFASRGDILDFFSVQDRAPVRIEFFDDEVESIRRFDIASQSSEGELEEAIALPSTDLLLSDNELYDFQQRLEELLKEDVSHLPEDMGEVLQSNAKRILERYKDKDFRPYLYRYFGFATKTPHSVLDYFDPRTVFVIDKERFLQASISLQNEADSYYAECRERLTQPRGLVHYMSPTVALGKRKVRYSEAFAKSSEDLVIDIKPVLKNDRGLQNARPVIDVYRHEDTRLILAVADIQEREIVKNILGEAKYPFKEIQGLDIPDKPGTYLSDASLSKGFESPSLKLAVLSSNEIFGRRAPKSRVASRYREATILKSHEDLRPGDYVVHEYNGIAQFIGVKTMDVGGHTRDYLTLVYAGGSKLYVPLEQFRLVRKYAAREGAVPKLSRLFSGDWEKRKKKIKETVDDLAERLLSLYKERASGNGFAFNQDDEEQKRFEASFPYKLTGDQARSLDEIKRDMEAPIIMDRLLCGDVGFGKTEVAFRAAFKALRSGKQVALLCPTTLLARQHYEVALKRFLGFEENIALLSRLISPKDQKKTMDGVKDGTVRFLIGTHRILSKEVEFQDLGLLIIDEEQRFGVEQKEKLKEYRNNVDVLSLSATPIPRTLQMSLLSIRPLSEINTAPLERMPVETYVAPFNESVTQELLGRELSRHGQAFYLHNRVETIYRKAARIQTLMPEAHIGVVHGQMSKEQVEDVMGEFYDGKIDILVATSIIENGIDVPNANLLIVEDADRFGLAQLYQIKGRVGRADRIAYAYLFYSPDKMMGEDAAKRLKAIQEFTELGSGYKIAQRDLLIRGAGNILGADQSGNIEMIGLDLYMKMLSEAIEEKRTGVIKEPPKPNKLFEIDAYIPASFASEEDRIAIYQELGSLSSQRAIDKYVAHLKDVYGRIPYELETLIEKKRIDLLADDPAFALVEENPNNVDIVLSDSFASLSGIGNDLFSLLVPYISVLKVTYIDRKLKIRYLKRDSWMKELKVILGLLKDLYKKKKEQKAS